MKKHARAISFLIIGSAPIVALAIACGSSSSGGDDSNGTEPPDATTNGDGNTVVNRDAQSAPDGQVDKTPSCDKGLPLSGDAPSFARTIGICSNAATDGFGLVSATFSRGFDQLDAAADAHFDAATYEIKSDAGSVQAGSLPKFGDLITPREGDLLGVLSTGYAREYDELGDAGDAGIAFADQSPLDGMNYPTGHAPPGFPQHTPGCAQSDLVNDMIDVKLTLKAPADAHGFQFDFDFYASDWPDFVCSVYNDAFVAYVNSSENHGENVALDDKHNSINVNTPYLDRCVIDGGVIGCGAVHDSGAPHAHCEAGAGELKGTGYGLSEGDFACNPEVVREQGGSTGWFTTSVPITPGETFTIEFMIWDGLDGVSDSTALIDNFQWLASTPGNVTTRAK